MISSFLCKKPSARPNESIIIGRRGGMPPSLSLWSPPLTWNKVFCLQRDEKGHGFIIIVGETLIVHCSSVF